VSKFRVVLFSGDVVLNVAVCSSLVAAGERQDEDSVGAQRRSEALMMLTEMCPSHALTIRSLCVRLTSYNFTSIISTFERFMGNVNSVTYIARFLA